MAEKMASPDAGDNDYLFNGSLELSESPCSFIKEVPQSRDNQAGQSGQSGASEFEAFDKEITEEDAEVIGHHLDAGPQEVRIQKKKILKLLLCVCVGGIL